MPFNDRQVEWMMKPLNMKRVKQREGKFSYLEAWDVIAHLNRVFGFGGWSKEVTEVLPIYESQRDPSKTGGWDVAYRATVRLVVRDPDGIVMKVSEDVATGQAQNQPSRGDAHDLAIKSAVADALKRAAKDLGDQWGLGLYNDGSGNSYVTESLAYGASPTSAPHNPDVVREQVAAVRDQMLGERP